MESNLQRNDRPATVDLNGLARSGMALAHRRGWLATTLALGLCIVVFPASRALAQGLSGNTANDRKPAPDFMLNDATGKRVRLSDFKGRVVVLDFWATWCHGCKTEIPWFMEFQDRYRHNGLAVIGASMDEDGWKSVRPFLQTNRLNYTIVLGTDALARSYGLDSMPMTVVIDRQGKIAASHVGVVDKDSFEQEIVRLLDRRKS